MGGVREESINLSVVVSSIFFLSLRVVVCNSSKRKCYFYSFAYLSSNLFEHYPIGISFTFNFLSLTHSSSLPPSCVLLSEHLLVSISLYGVMQGIFIRMKIKMSVESKKKVNLSISLTFFLHTTMRNLSSLSLSLFFFVGYTAMPMTILNIASHFLYLEIISFLSFSLRFFFARLQNAATQYIIMEVVFHLYVDGSFSSIIRQFLVLLCSSGCEESLKERKSE